MQPPSTQTDPAIPLPTGPTADPLRRRALLRGLAGAAGVAAVASLAKAGPLDPPAGPVAPTGKTLAEIEPRTAVNAANTPGDAGAVFIISQPGSYYLPGNINVPANKVGIRVTASDVTLDLRGFRLSGAGATGSSGINDGGTSPANVAVHGGTIENMGGHAIFLFEGPFRFSDLTLRDNGGFGIITNARAHLERVVAVNNCTTTTTNPAGLLLGSDTTVIECTAASNRGYGIYAGANVLILNCTASQNTNVGINVGGTCAVVGCTASSNGAAGIAMQHSGIAESCTAAGNAGAGITGSFGSLVRGCTATSNGGGGFSVWEGSAVARCTASSNTGAGFTLATGCSITGCSAGFNTGTGINAGAAPGSTIAGCITRNNAAEGIVVGARCTVRENDCQANGGPNIIATNTSNRIEGNLCGGGLYGVWVTAPRNMIVRNSCSQNQVNWSLFSNCIYGPVVNRTNPAASGMSGNGTVASTLATTDPHANFSF